MRQITSQIDDLKVEGQWLEYFDREFVLDMIALHDDKRHGLDGHAVIDAIEEENLCDRANELGAELVATLKDIQQTTSDVVTDIRALGSMVAVELETAEQAKVVQNYAMENGLLLLTCGKYGNVIRFLYPLTIPAEQFRQGLDILKQGFATLKAGSAKAMEQSA